MTVAGPRSAPATTRTATADEGTAASGGRVGRPGNGPAPYDADTSGGSGFDAWRQRRSSFVLVLCGLVALLVCSLVVSVGIGPVSIAPGEALRILLHQVVGDMVVPTGPAVESRILLDVRLPRVLTGAIVGAGLSVVGVALQALVRNPLADPHIIGVTAGGALGATVVIVSGVGFVGIYTLSAAAFVGALLALVLVYVLAQHSGRLSPLRLILAGVAMSYLFSALSSFLIFRTEIAAAARSMTFWMLGGMGAARWSYLGAPAVAVGIGIVLLLLQARRLDAIMLGDDTAASLGVDPSRFRKQLFVLAALISGVLVAVAGGIGFVALMIPHIARTLVGSAHRRLLPVATLGGASFVIWADVGARMFVAPDELPIGVITAFCGAPFFLWLMRTRDTRHRIV